MTIADRINKIFRNFTTAAMNSCLVFIIRIAIVYELKGNGYIIFEKSSFYGASRGVPRGDAQDARESPLPPPVHPPPGHVHPCATGSGFCYQCCPVK